MTHNVEKEREELSIIGRILSLEAVLFLMGCVSLLYGIMNGAESNIFFGIVIIPGVFLLAKVRKKDWKKHWDELEKEQQANNERMKRKNGEEK